MFSFYTKTANNTTCEVIKILDEDDDTSEYDNETTPLMQRSEDVPEVVPLDYNKRTGDKVMGKKLKLARDAAIKRLSTM